MKQIGKIKFWIRLGGIFCALFTVSVYANQKPIYTFQDNETKEYVYILEDSRIFHYQLNPDNPYGYRVFIGPKENMHEFLVQRAILTRGDVATGSMEIELLDRSQIIYQGYETSESITRQWASGDTHHLQQIFDLPPGFFNLVEDEIVFRIVLDGVSSENLVDTAWIRWGVQYKNAFGPDRYSENCRIYREESFIKNTCNPIEFTTSVIGTKPKLDDNKITAMQMKIFVENDRWGTPGYEITSARDCVVKLLFQDDGNACDTTVVDEGTTYHISITKVERREMKK